MFNLRSMGRAVLALAFVFVVGAAQAEGPYWPWRCDFASSTTGFADSICAPADHKIARLDVWSLVDTGTDYEELLSIISVVSPVVTPGGLIRINASTNPTVFTGKVSASSASATYNTTIFLQAFENNTKGFRHPISETFPVWTDRIWLVSTSSTAHWGWCAYCTRWNDNLRTTPTTIEFLAQ